MVKLWFVIKWDCILYVRIEIWPLNSIHWWVFCMALSVYLNQHFETFEWFEYGMFVVCNFMRIQIYVHARKAQRCSSFLFSQLWFWVCERNSTWKMGHMRIFFVCFHLGQYTINKIDHCIIMTNLNKFWFAFEEKKVSFIISTKSFPFDRSVFGSINRVRDACRFGCGPWHSICCFFLVLIQLAFW